MQGLYLPEPNRGIWDTLGMVCRCSFFSNACAKPNSIGEQTHILAMRCVHTESQYLCLFFVPFFYTLDHTVLHGEMRMTVLG